jgi:hypothetical protein
MPVGIDFFAMLGVAPELGRVFEPDDLHQACTVVLRHSFWMEAFGGQKNVIGSHVSLNEDACTVVGVMPPQFAFYPDAAAMWMLLTPGSAIARDPKAAVGVFGLLKNGVSIKNAEDEIERLYQNSPGNDMGAIRVKPVVYPLSEQFAYLTGPTLRLSVMVLFGAVGFVLLIACLNIANLLLGKSVARQKELALRAALGSGGARLARQLLTEALLLSVCGATLGILLALAAVHSFRTLNPVAMPPGNPVRVNLPVLGFFGVPGGDHRFRLWSRSSAQSFTCGFDGCPTRERPDVIPQPRRPRASPGIGRRRSGALTCPTGWRRASHRERGTISLRTARISCRSPDRSRDSFAQLGVPPRQSALSILSRRSRPYIDAR